MIIQEAEISYYKKLFNEQENRIKLMWKTLSPNLNDLYISGSNFQN